MADQAEPANEQEEPTQDDTGGIDWESRYNNLRPQYDRTQNELSQYQDPEYRQQLFQELASEFGYSFDGSDEYVDPTEQLRAELRAEFQQELSARDQRAALEGAANHAMEFADRALDKLKVEDEKVREWIETRATAMPAIHDDEGFVVPDIEAAYKDYQDLINAEKQRWGNTKQGVVAATEGQSNTGVPNWRNEQDPHQRKLMRDAWAMEQVQLRLNAQDS